ncbi:hypothetical protein ACOZ4I_08765 [Haloarcula salina]|uniref:hypothetical protein n=1 Tax=Haloarcula salina TaxID=1429914 RepID=UPI003C6EE2DB
MSLRQSWAAVGALAVLCLAVGAGGAAAVQSDAAAQTQPTATPTDGNDTQQENPAEVTDEDYAGQTSTWLARRLSGRLENGTVSLSQGQYERARDLLGDDYDQRLEQYVDVAGETGTESDDAAAEEFEAAGENQRAFVDGVERYRTQYDRYQAAREAGDERRARRLAREMDRTAANVSNQSQRLNRNYANIENATAVSLDESQTLVNETTANVTELQATVREETLVGTTLTVRAASPTASFTDPATITGQIRTENGSVLADRTVELRVGNRTRNVTTDADGAFETAYRPRSARVGEQSIAVAYRPAPESVYLTDSDQFGVEVQQVAPTITIERSPASVSYGEPLSVSAAVTVDGTPVDGVPIEVVVGEEPLVRAATDPNGSMATSVRLPATVDDGARSVTVRIPYRDRAIANVNASERLVVARTVTRLSLNASTTGEGVVARGRLRTADGRPVTNRPVRVRVTGGDGRVVETDENGRFETRLSNVSGGAATATVRATYDEPSSNLGNANATATVRLRAGGGGAADVGAPRSVLEGILSVLFGADGSSIPVGVGGGGYLWVILGLVGVVMLAGVWVVTTRFDVLPDRNSAESPSFAASATEAEGFDASEGPAVTVPRPNSDERIDAHLDRGAYDAAVMTAYRSLKTDLAANDAELETATHWELLDHYRRNGTEDDRVESIQTVVEAFELAAFSPTSLDAERAEDAVETARALRRQ